MTDKTAIESFLREYGKKVALIANDFRRKEDGSSNLGEIKKRLRALESKYAEQAIEASLGHEYHPDPAWEKWHESLQHRAILSIRDAVEQLMFEAIEFGGDMGPDGNVCEGIDEGDVNTRCFISAWVERFQSLVRGECHDKNGFDPSFGFECVECGTTVDAYMCSEYAGIQEQFRYCPGCGAKVVRE